MKKTLIVLGLILLSVGIAFAGPFLISDPAINITKYQIRLSADNGVTWSAWAESPAQTDGSMRYDIGSYAAGNYKGEAQAYGTYTVTDSTSGQVSTAVGWSASAPFVLGTPSSTIKVRVIK